MTLREEIANIVRGEHWSADERIVRAGDEYDATDRIIAAVREALLAPDVVCAGARAIVADPGFGGNTWTDDARNVLTAALDAMTEGTDR